MKRLGLLLSLGSFACSSGTEPAARSTPAVAPVIVADGDAGRPPVVEAPKATPGFRVVVEGSCSDYGVFAVGHERLLATSGVVYQANGTLLDADATYNDMTGEGVDRVAEVVAIGGTDLQNFWISRMTQSRTSDSISVQVRVNGAWKFPQDPQDYGGFGPVAYAHPSGALWIASNPMLAASRFEEFASGVLVKKSKMPNLGMIGTEYGFLPDGELLVVGPGAWDSGSSKAQLKRWSPSRPVNDVLVAPRYSHKPPMTLRIQPNSDKPRVVVGLGAPLGAAKKGTLLDWKDEKLVPVAMASQLTTTFSSDLALDGTLYALLEDGTLLRETPAGEVTKIPVPEGGTVFAKLTNDPWIVGKSGALFRYVGGAVTPVALPAGAWEQADHTPLQAKRVTVLGPDEAYVYGTRADRGDGWKKPRTTSVLFANVAGGAPLRCGAPLRAGSVFVYPPVATAACTEPHVVVNEVLKPAALKSLGDVGTPLTFGPPKLSRTALRAPSFDAAKTWAKSLSSAGHDAEIVCGTPAATSIAISPAASKRGP